MPLTIPSLSTIINDLIATYVSMRPTASRVKYSDLWINVYTWGHAFKWTYEILARVYRVMFPTTCEDDDQDRWLYFVGASDGQGSYGKLKPHVSSVTNGLRVTCTAGTPTVDQADEIVDTNTGLRFRPDESYMFGGPGTADLDAVSIDIGFETNLETGHTGLEFVSPPAGIQKAIDVVADFDYGRPLEDNTAGGARLLSHMQEPSMSGNWPDWKRTIEDASNGTIDAWIWKERNNGPYGWGTTDYAITQRAEVDYDRVATQTQMDAADDALDDRLPETLLKQARQLTVDTTNTETYVDVTYQVADGTPQSLLCDWDAEANQRTVTVQTPGSKKIKVNAVYAADVITSGDKVLLAGHEVTVDDAPGDGGLGMDEMTFTTWPSTFPSDLTDRGDATGFAVCAGGGMVMDIYNAVSAYLNGIDGDIPEGRGTLPKIGPAKGDYGAPQSGWDDTFRLHCIKSAATMAGDGYVMDFDSVTIGGVAADYGPTYTVTSTVEMVLCMDLKIYQEAV